MRMLVYRWSIGVNQYILTLAELRMGQPGTVLPSLVFGPLSLMAHPIFWPTHLFCVWPTHFRFGQTMFCFDSLKLINCRAF